MTDATQPHLESNIRPDPAPFRLAGGSSQQIARVLEDVVARRERGEDLPDARVLYEHPTLAPALLPALDSLRRLRLAYVVAERAGPAPKAVAAMTSGELAAPIGD